MDGWTDGRMDGWMVRNAYCKTVAVFSTPAASSSSIVSRHHPGSNWNETTPTKSICHELQRGRAAAAAHTCTHNTAHTMQGVVKSSLGTRRVSTRSTACKENFM